VPRSLKPFKTFANPQVGQLLPADLELIAAFHLCFLLQTQSNFLLLPAVTFFGSQPSASIAIRG
jgi:hypothetical protein